MGSNDKLRSIDKIKSEYGNDYNKINWISETIRKSANITRERLLSSVKDFAVTAYKGSKLDVKKLSPGCRLCGEGSWSCLFVNGKCNCRCFYCPTEQDDVSVPMTNTVAFTKTADYVNYIEEFGFRGVSMSGGEPLLTFDTTIKFISAVKKKFGDNVHLWLYTNGTLATEEKMTRLKDAGLDEIRFDIGAANYNLAKAKLAVNKIKTVTVEIPAIPEDVDIMKQKLFEMKENGIDFLNLHQLRLTPFNFKKLAVRNYTFIHGEKATVLESELTALELLKYSFDKNIDIPINYCSFDYKNRYQRSAARKRNALKIKKDYESITENGFIRSTAAEAQSQIMQEQIQLFNKNEINPNLWFVDASKSRLYFHSDLIGLVDFKEASLCLNYYGSAILPSLTYRNSFHKIILNSGKEIYIEKIKEADEIKLTGSEINKFISMLSGSYNPHDFKDKKWKEASRFEYIKEGLQEYY